MSLAAPVVILVAAIGFVAFCLFDLARAAQVRHLPKLVWLVIIVVSIPLGGMVYLAVGRQAAASPDGPAEGTERPQESPPSPGRPVEPAPPATTAPADDREWPPNPGRLVEHAPPATPTMPAGPVAEAAGIEIDRLSKHFGSVVAVDDLSFTVGPGRVTGFLGPNGAGKTTTMRIILGLQAADGGRALVAGRSYRHVVRPLREVGSLLDANAAHPGRTARSHLASIAASTGIGRHRVGEVLDLTGLAAVADRRVRQYSLGMKQRLGIAIALLGNPPMLVFDEPTNGLDPEGILWIRELFKSLAAEGRTVFVSSHLMSEMALTADHLVIIGRGRLLADMSTLAFVEANARGDVLVRAPRAGELADLLIHAGAAVVASGDGKLSVTGVGAPAIAELALAQRMAIYELTPRHASLEEAYLDLTHGSVEYRAGTAGEHGSPGVGP